MKNKTWIIILLVTIAIWGCDKKETQILLLDIKLAGDAVFEEDFVGKDPLANTAVLMEYGVEEVRCKIHPNETETFRDELIAFVRTLDDKEVESSDALITRGEDELVAVFKKPGMYRLLLFLEETSAVSDTLDVQVTKNIPDENFRKVLKEVIPSAFKSDDMFDPQDEAIEDLIRLDCSQRGIKTLKGIQFLTSLKYLHCAYNNLVTFDVGNMPSLDTAFCQYNYIDSINLENTNALKFLNCKGNRLSSLKLENHIFLKLLDCSENRIKDLVLYNTYELENLNCSNNFIEDFVMTSFDRLKTLKFFGNLVTELDVSRATILETLLLFRNENLTTLKIPDIDDIKCSDDIKSLNDNQDLDISVVTYDAGGVVESEETHDPGADCPVP